MMRILLAVVAGSLAAVSALPSFAYAVFPGANGRIYTQVGDPIGGTWSVRSVCPDGSGVKQVAGTSVRAADAAGYPAPSPDGTKVAWLQWDAGPSLDNPEIWVADADGSNAELVVGSGRFPNAPSWSPDGTKLAFSGYQAPHAGRQPLVVEVSTGAVTPLLPQSPTPSTVWSPLSSSFAPAWSANGETVFFEGEPSGGGDRSIYSVAASGGSATLRFGGAGESLQWLDLSPDGSNLATVRQVGFGDAFDTIVHPVGGGAPVVVGTFDNATGVGLEHGSFAPDGTKLLFTNRSASIATDGRLATSDPDGANVALLPSGVGGSHARWSTNVDDCTPPGSDSMGINEVALGDARFVELLDPADEPFPSEHGPYKLVAYDAAGARHGAHVISTALLQGRDNTQPLLVSTAVADAAFAVTGDEPLALTLPTPGQMCFTRGAAETKVNCVAWGCVSSAVSPIATRIPVPPSGSSSQRQGIGSDTFHVATPTPGTANAGGLAPQACPTAGTGPDDSTPPVVSPPPATPLGAPVLRIVGPARVRFVRGAVTIPVECAADRRSCTTTIELSVRSRAGTRRPGTAVVVIGTARATIAAGARRSVRIGLSPVGRRLLVGRRTHQATVRARVVGAARPVVRTVTLTR